MDAARLAHAQAPEAPAYRSLEGEPTCSFSLLVPARHEEEVLGDTLDTLAAVDHPDVEVIAIIGHDDPGTEAVARAAAARNPDRVRVVIDYNVPKNKPKALNTALAECTGDVVGIFDAEDEVHPKLLALRRRALRRGRRRRRAERRAAMNAPHQLVGAAQLLEYYFWFRSRLHYHADAQFIPLGGNTVFTRTELLREVGGWDPECLAEDCEIGVRLSSRGAVVAVAYEPEIVAPGKRPPGVSGLWSSSAPVGIRDSCRCWARASGGSCPPVGSGCWPAIRCRCRSCKPSTGLLVPVSLGLIFFATVPTGRAHHLLPMRPDAADHCRWRPPASATSVGCTASGSASATTSGCCSAPFPIRSSWRPPPFAR